MPTARDIKYFKAGTWAGLPLDYVTENYVVPYGKKHLSEKAFYSRLKKMPKYKGKRTRRKLTEQAMIVSQDSSSKRPIIQPYIFGKSYKRLKTSNKMWRPASPEMKCKFQELSVGTQSVGALTTEQLYQVTQGAEFGERIGSKIRAHHIDVRGYIRNASDSTHQTCRVLFVQDNKPQLGNHTINFFQAEGSDNDPVNFASGGDLSQVSKKINPSRYRVISDRRFKLRPRVSANESTSYVNLNYRVKINRNMEYLTDTGLETDVNRIQPNIFCFVFVELESSTTGADVLSRDIQLYQYFTG